MGSYGTVRLSFILGIRKKLPNEHEALNKYCFNVGPAAQTVDQH